MQPKHRSHLVCAAQFELAETAPLFDPAKHPLDAAPGIDRLGVARVGVGAPIDGGTTRAGRVLSERHAASSQSTEVRQPSPGVVVLDGTVVRLGRVCIELAGQQGVWIVASAVGLVAEIDAAEITLGPFLALLWSAKTVAQP